MALEREYRRYLTGCDRFGYTPLDEAAFAARWQEFVDHAARLKAGEASNDLASIEAETRAEMQRRVKDDPFIKAILVGLAEESS